MSQITRIKAGYFFMSLFFLLSGMFLYATIRDADMLIYAWFGKPGFLPLFAMPPAMKMAVHPIVLYNLPDGLWFLSGLLLIRSLWITDKKWCTRYGVVFCLLAFVLEILQLHKNVPGTFDGGDLVCMAAAALAEQILFYVFIRRRIT